MSLCYKMKSFTVYFSKYAACSSLSTMSKDSPCGKIVFCLHTSVRRETNNLDSVHFTRQSKHSLEDKQLQGAGFLYSRPLVNAESWKNTLLTKGVFFPPLCYLSVSPQYKSWRRLWTFIAIPYIRSRSEFAV